MLRRAAPALIACFTLVAVAGCGRSNPQAQAAQLADAAPVIGAQTGGPIKLEPPPFDGDVKSLRLRRSIAVRFEPRTDAKPLGTVAQDTRVGFQRAASGAD